ncbi:MAG: hypothetical protein RSA41_07580 [Christensenella sp.]
MKNIEKILARAATKLPHPPIEKILTANAPQMCEHDYITEQPTAQPVRKKPARILTYAATACAMLAILVFGLVANMSPLAMYSIVELDINPGIELRLDKHDKVLEVVGINDDAKAMLAHTSFADKTLDESLSMLTALLVQDGYFPQNRGAILLSVSDRDDMRAAELSKAITIELEKTLKSNGIHANIMAQDIKSDRKLQNSAQKYGISMGHMSIIEHIMAVNPAVTIEELLKLSSQELIDMLDDTGVTADDGHFKLYSSDDDDEDDYESDAEPTAARNTETPAPTRAPSAPTSAPASAASPTPTANTNKTNTHTTDDTDSNDEPHTDSSTDDTDSQDEVPDAESEPQDNNDDSAEPTPTYSDPPEPSDNPDGTDENTNDTDSTDPADKNIAEPTDDV